MPVGIYRVQSPGFPKIVYCEGQSHKTVSTEPVGTPKQIYNTEVRCDIHPANRSFSLEERKKSQQSQEDGRDCRVDGRVDGRICRVEGLDYRVDVRDCRVDGRDCSVGL